MRDITEMIPNLYILMRCPNVCLYAQKVTTVSGCVKISFHIFSIRNLKSLIQFLGLSVSVSVVIAVVIVIVSLIVYHSSAVL